MIKINGEKIGVNYFPDGTLLLKEKATDYLTWFDESLTITWLFENNEELIHLIFLVKHFKDSGYSDIKLVMPYIPNARQDRVKNAGDVFTLKYFAQIINSLNFTSVKVLDPHSHVSEALIDRISIDTPENFVKDAIVDIEVMIDNKNLMLFYPDEGAMKRYSDKFEIPYAFGIKKREWESGKIVGLDVSGMVERIPGSAVLIVDDICSRGGTFYHSAKKLKELGASKVYLYVSHCENTILDGEVLTSGLIDRVYTTNSIFTKQHKKIEVFNYEY